MKRLIPMLALMAVTAGSAASVDSRQRAQEPALGHRLAIQSPVPDLAWGLDPNAESAADFLLAQGPGGPGDNPRPRDARGAPRGPGGPGGPRGPRSPRGPVGPGFGPGPVPAPLPPDPGPAAIIPQVLPLFFPPHRP